jgi:serine/threonine protein kinase
MPGDNMGLYDAGSRLEPGTTIGRYRIVRLIGDGGMGAVYEAEQESPRRTVALKLVKPEFTSLELLRRFEQESRALGRLQHPGIAQIYEAGAADTGHGPQPYFAMEFIHGKSLREYAGQHHLSARDRLELLARVCDAVHHAHQRGLIHRDLKPDNILVDESGQPKVLDFGVARVTDGDMQTTLWTGIGQLVGTLAYMSPEQVLDHPLELDTRSDVYALGVVLYELLAKRMPYSIGKTVLEAARAIREADPARLSSFDRSYRGDIETIAARALEKDKTLRYSSAAELAADIRRYLNDEPIVARPPSASYQLQKFARRNKALVTGIVAVLVVSVAGAAYAKYQAALNRRDRDKSAWQFLAHELLLLSDNRDKDEFANLLVVEALHIHSRTPDQPGYLVEKALEKVAARNPVGRVISGCSSPVISRAFSRDETKFACGSEDGTVKVFDLSKPTAPALLEFKLPSEAHAVAISPDGNLLAAASSAKFGIWNVREPKPPPSRDRDEPTVLPHHVQGTINSVAFSGSHLAIGSYRGVSIWDLSNLDSAVHEFDSNSDIKALAFSADGSRLVTSGSSGVRTWDFRNAETPQLITQLDPDSKFISVAISSDNNHVAAHRPGDAHRSGEVKVWDLRLPDSVVGSLGHTPIADRSFQPEVNWANSVEFSPEGKLLASSGADGIVRVWIRAQPDVKPWLSLRGVGPLWTPAAHQLCTLVTRNFSPKERQFLESIPNESTCPGLPAGTDAR